MNDLTQSKCEACSIDALPLFPEEIEALMSDVEGWKLIYESNIKKLKRVFETKNYTKSMKFTNEVAALAESEDHHPMLIVEYGTVTVVWWSHKIKGLHKNDFIMAAKTSAIFEK